MSKLTDLLAENRRLQRQVDYLIDETRRYYQGRAEAAEAECARLRAELAKYDTSEDR